MYPTEVIVDYGILRDNFRVLQAFEPQCTLVPIVKSDAYGHGIVNTSRAFLEGGATRLALFRVAEAIKLRQAGLTCPLWVLMGALPEEVDDAVTNDLTLACYNLEMAAMLSNAAIRRQRRVNVHLVIDTGMGRLGVLPSQAASAIAALRRMPFLELRGIVSHVAKAVEPENPITRGQVAAFRQVVKLLPLQCTENHLCASEAWKHRLAPELSFVRPGICLYAAVKPAGCASPLTRGAMMLRTRLISVKALPAGHNVSYNCICTLRRPSIVGIAPLGYEDGYNRSLSNKGRALVHGQRVPVLGTICMSMTMLDLTDIGGAAVGDEAVFLGRQGNAEITIAELAELAGTVPHELLCAIGKNRIN